MFSDKILEKQYKAFCAWKNAHPPRFYIIFDTHLQYSGKPLNRYIVITGVEVCRFFSDVIISTISGIEQLHEPIDCLSHAEASRLCMRLNAKYVHDNEPETFRNCPSWQEVYNKYINIE